MADFLAFRRLQEQEPLLQVTPTAQVAPANAE